MQFSSKLNYRRTLQTGGNSWESFANDLILQTKNQVNVINIIRNIVSHYVFFSLFFSRVMCFNYIIEDTLISNIHFLTPQNSEKSSLGNI